MPKKKPDWQGAMQFFSILYARWQDEKKYEDFEEYKKAMKKNLPDGCSEVSMTNKPFRLRFKYDGHEREMVIRKNMVFLTTFD